MTSDNPDRTLPFGDAGRVDMLREEFAQAWKAGAKPRIEDFLVRVEDGVRFALFRELLKHDVRLRRNRRDPATTGEYVERFPDYAAAIREICGEDVQGDATEGSGVPRSGLHVRCPHCHNPIELVPDDELESIQCGSCGSQFSLTTDEEDATRDARSIAQIGHFKLVERLGMGAFGSVWKAQDLELDRTVAIKIPRGGQLDKQQQDFFFREARSAAQLRHPNIVPVYEVGRDGDTLYIVSELVRGITLSDRLTAGPMTAREAAELCAKIAEALHHAHEHGVIHRDLKPANIMLDAAGEPHLMDFGLARREANEITMTLDGQVLGTPAYMSPEQAQGEAHTADRRSDVYSLGVILFELLTGELPFRGNARMMIHQVIHEEPPSPRKLNASVPKDLETIALKCLEKDPTRRYRTAQELSTEFRRFLSGVPILARPISRRERAAKWVRRHQAVSALSSAVVIALLLGTVVSAYFAIDARRQASMASAGEREALSSKQEADAARVEEARARQDAEAVNDFLVKAFESPDPARYGRSITVAEVLDRAEAELAEEMVDQPLTRAALLDAIGRSRLALGIYEPALGPLTQARELRERELGADHQSTLASMNNLAYGLASAGRNDEAIQLYEQALVAKREKLGADDPGTLISMSNLANEYEMAGRIDEAIQLHEQALATKREKLGADDPQTLISMTSLAAAYYSADRLDEAIPLQEEALAAMRKKLGADHPHTLTSMGHLANAYFTKGRSDEAISLYLLALSARRKSLGAEHPDTLTTIASLAGAYSDAKRFDEAIPQLEQVLAARRKNLPADHPDTLLSMNNLANVFMEAGRIDDALPLFEQALAARRQKLGVDHSDTLRSMHGLAYAYAKTGRMDEAISLCEQALAARRAKLKADHPDVLFAMKNLAHVHVMAGNIDDAIPLFEQVLAAQRRNFGADHTDTLKTVQELAKAQQTSDQ